MQSPGKLMNRTAETIRLGELPSALKDLTSEAKSSDGNSTVCNVTELQPSPVNKTVEKATLPDEETSTLNDSSNETQPSVVNRVDDSGTEIQFSGVNATAETTVLAELPSPLKVVANEGQSSGGNRAVENVTEIHPSGVNRTVVNATASDERNSTQKDLSNKIQPSNVNRVDNNGTEMQSSGVNTTAVTTILEELHVPPTLKDLANDAQSSDGNARAVENVTEMQSSGVNKTIKIIIEDVTIPDERTSISKDLSNETQPFGVIRVDDIVTEMQFSGVNTTTETTILVELPSTPMDLANEAQFLSGNAGTVENVTKMQQCGMNETIEDTTVPDERTSIPKDSSNETQPSGVNIVNDNGTELQFCGVNTTTESTVLGVLPSTPMDLSNEGTSSGGNVRTVENVTEMQFSGVNTTTETTIQGELPSTPMDLANEAQFLSGNVGTVENVTKMQQCGVNETIENTTVPDERTSIPKDSSNETQPSGVNIVNDNGTELQFCGVNTTADSTVLGVLPSTPMDLSNEGTSSGGNVRTVENVIEMQSSGVTIQNTTIPGERTSIPKASSNETQPSGVNRVDDTQMQCFGETEINTSVSNFNEPTVSCVTTNSGISGETVFTQKGISSTPLADFNEPTISCISNEEIQSTLKCVSDTPVADLINPAAVLCDMIVEMASSCIAMEHSTESLQQIEASLKDLSESVSSLTADDRFKELPSTQEVNQPSRKKIKLSKSVNIPVEDVLGGVHTRLCECDCTSRHSPLVLAAGVQNDCKLRTCLENHLKLSIKNGWRSSKGIQDPSSKLRQLVFHLAMLFGKIDLLEFMLKAQLGNSQYFANSARNSPLTTILKNMHHFMPTSSFDEKLSVFQQLLQLLVKYDSNVLLVQDDVSEDTILHMCAKHIRELTNEIKAKQSVVSDFSELQGLLDQRMLYERFCAEMIHMFKRLGVEGPLHQSQILEFFDVRNKDGETMSKILQDEELTRRSCYVGSIQKSSPAQEDRNTEYTRKQLSVDKENCENIRAEGDTLQSTTVAETSSLSQTNDLQSSYPTGQNVSVSTNVVNLSGKGTTLSRSHTGNTGAQPGHHNDLTTWQVISESSTGSETDSADEGKTPSQSPNPSQSPDPSSSDTGTQLTSGHYIDLPTLQVNTASPLAESYIIPTGKHTFVCPPNCNVQHHDLIQLLCATPDHNSILLPAEENEACSNYRTYLKDSSWDLNDVVPDPLPNLCYSIVHLACLLGKYKALEVFSEFGFHPLIHTAITEETPLHMAVRLLRHQLGGLFLCDAVISIVKTLNRYSHAISLFSAKDYRGNTVLHSLAKMILPKNIVSEVTVIVYLFRVFVHFLLQGQNSSPSVPCQILTSALQDCNKAGESVEALLQKTIVGKQLWMYLASIMEGSVAAGVSSRVLDSSNGKALDQREEHNTTEMEGRTTSGSTHQPSAIRRDDSSRPRHTESDEPESFIDFILSNGGGIIENSDTKMLVKSCHGEYQKRLRFFQSGTKVLSLKKELKLARKKEKSVTKLEKNEAIIKSSIEWNKTRMRAAIEDRKKQKEQIALNNERLMLLEELERDIQHWECNNNTGAHSSKSKR